MTDQNTENIIPKGWVEIALGEIIDISSGKSRPRNKGEFPVYGGNGILDYADSFNFEDETIIVGRVGAYCGATYFETSKFRLSDNALGIKSNEKSDIKFLYYFLINQNLNKKAIGGAQPLLTQGILNGIEIKIPQNKEDQKAIASVLSSFDDKIELLREQNKTLEATAQTIFKEWFGKYSVDESEALPDGWRVGKLGEVVENFDSQRIPISGDKRVKGSYPYYGATGINDYVDDYIFDGIYTLLGEDGSVIKENGKPFTQYIWGKNRVNNHAHVLKGKNGFSTELIKIILDSTLIAPYVNGAVQLKINQTNMNSIPVIVPDEKSLNNIDKKIQPIFSKYRLNIEQIQSLSKTRDVLLPKLMRGEVRVEG